MSFKCFTIGLQRFGISWHLAAAILSSLAEADTDKKKRHLNTAGRGHAQANEL
jgi:hypothetical protein